MNKVENNNINITTDILKSYITTNWFCGLDSCNMKEFDKYVDELLEVSKRDLVQQQDLNLSDDEKKFIRSLLSEEVNRNRDILLNLKINKENNTSKLLLHFKETDIEHYNQCIKNMKDDYIKAVNLSYKMFNEQPKDWSTGLSLHNVVCRDFNIERNEFLF